MADQCGTSHGRGLVDASEVVDVPAGFHPWPVGEDSKQRRERGHQHQGSHIGGDRGQVEGSGRPQTEAHQDDVLLGVTQGLGVVHDDLGAAVDEVLRWLAVRDPVARIVEEEHVTPQEIGYVRLELAYPLKRRMAYEVGLHEETSAEVGTIRLAEDDEERALAGLGQVHPGQVTAHVDGADVDVLLHGEDGHPATEDVVEDVDGVHLLGQQRRQTETDIRLTDHVAGKERRLAILALDWSIKEVRG